MKFGMNLLLWTAELNDDILPVLEALKQLGYDGVEIPLFNYDLDYVEWGRRLDDLGLERTAVTVRAVEDNPISPDAETRSLGIALNRQAIECCAALNAQTLCGPFHSALGHFSEKGPTQDEIKWAADSLRPVVEYGASCNVDLALESLNRFECYLANTAAQVLEIAKLVDHPGCRCMYDTFHAHIEEENVRGPITLLGEMLHHVHISESNRSTPGQGQVNWPDTFRALKEINYDGWLTVEAFGLAMPEIAAATKIWRRMYKDEITLAEEALQFMKNLHNRHFL